jgi:hypothetical protein
MGMVTTLPTPFLSDNYFAVIFILAVLFNTLSFRRWFVLSWGPVSTYINLQIPSSFKIIQY